MTKRQAQATAERARFDQIAAQLSAEFSASGWQPSYANFSPREFVIWRNRFFDVAGTPVGREPVATCCEHPEDVLRFLTEQSAPLPERKKPEPDPAPEPQVVERVIEKPVDNPEHLARIAELEAALAAKPKEVVVEKIVERVVEVSSAPLPGPGEKLVPDEISSLMEDGESLSDAVNRMTPDLDSLINLAGSLDDAAVKAAIGAMSSAKRIQWVEQLNDEKGRLRRARDTDKEDIPREARIDRLTNLFARVGEKQ